MKVAHLEHLNGFQLIFAPRASGYKLDRLSGNFIYYFY